MANVYQIVDPDDESVVVVDLNALGMDISQNGFAVLEEDLDLGRADPDIVLIGDEDPDAAEVTWPPVKMDLTLFARNTSFDAVRDMVEDLQAILAEGGYVLRTKPDGSATYRYADLLPSPIPALLGSERATLEVVGQFIRNGYPLEILRRALWRGEAQAPVVQVVSNAAPHMTVENDGTAPGLIHARVEPTAGKVVQATVAARSYGVLQDFADIAHWAASTMTLGTGTTVVADADAEGGNALRVNATATGFQKRGRKVIVPATPGATRGRFRLVCGVRSTAAGRHRVQARYAVGDRNPVEVALPAKRFDATDLEDFHYVPLDLGELWIPDGGTVTVEVWTSEVEEAGFLHLSDFTLVPVDERACDFRVPGFARVGSNPTTWQGDTLRTVAGTPVVKNDTIRLNSVNDSAGRPDGPIQIETGRHRVRAKVTLKNLNEDKVVLGELQVYEGGVLLKKHAIRSSDFRPQIEREVSVGFDAQNGVAYDYRVVLTSKPANSQARITVHWIRDDFQRYAGATDDLVIDARKRRAILETAGSEASRLASANGGFPEAAPRGPTLLQWRLTDDPETGYGDVTDQPVGKHLPTRAAQVTVTVTPRYF